MCFIINVQCTLDNCAVSFCCSAAASPQSRTSLRLKMREVFAQGAKTENEEWLVKIQRGRKGCKTEDGISFCLCCSAAASPQRRISFNLKMREIQIEDERKKKRFYT